MKRFGKMTGAALLAALLAGCTTDSYDERMQGYSPEMPHEVHPIEVVKGSVKLRLPVASGRLTPRERDMVRRLTRQISSLNTPVVITRPKGSVKGELLAAAVTRELLDGGVEKGRIVHRTGGGREVSISVRRKFAVTNECGRWNKPLNETARNTTHPNFGCAHQFNIAAQVDNPEDFERPRVMDPADAVARSNVIRKYRSGGQ